MRFERATGVVASTSGLSSRGRLLQRAAALAGFVGLLLTQAACPLEPDPEVLEACKPQQAQCLQNDRIRRCSDDGIWGTPEPFVCVNSTCQIMGGEPVCM